MTETSAPRVLVLLATYNGEAWIGAQLTSILCQEQVEVSILISDDGSSDGTPRLIRDAVGADRRIHMLPSLASSGSAGANFRRLFREASAEGVDFVALSDQDDLWLPQKLISAVERLDITQSDGYSCSVAAFWPDGREKIVPQVARTRPADFLFEGAGQGCTFVLRAHLFRTVADFCRAHPDSVRALHYHDWLIYLLARTWLCRWYFDPRPWIRYRQHGNNEIGARGSFAGLANRIRLIRSGWYGLQVRAAAALYRKAGGTDVEALRISETLAPPARAPLFLPVRRVRFAIDVLVHSRRRFSDRVFLMAAVLVGWLN